MNDLFKFFIGLFVKPTYTKMVGGTFNSLIDDGNAYKQSVAETVDIYSSSTVTNNDLYTNSTLEQ